MLEGDAVNLVVHVQTLDVLSVVLHNHIDKVVHGGGVVAHENLAVEELVVAQDGRDELLGKMDGGGSEGDFHATGFFRLEVDIGGVPVEPDPDGFEFGFEERALLGFFGGVENHHDQVGGLVEHC